MSTAISQEYGRANLLITGAQFAFWLFTIELMHVDASLWLKIPVLLVWCLMMQGVFSMMHEAFHDAAHANPSINRFIGIFTATLFGTSYTLYKVNHLGHHVRNRQPPELSDVILEDDDPVKKITMYYFAICGGIWLGSIIGSLILPLLPSRWVHERTAAMRNGYALSIAEFRPRDWQWMRIEWVIGVLFYIAIFSWTQWQVATVLVCYAAFAFSWSSLQWIYHVRTPLHVVEGAYDLRLPNWMRLLFLNFNYNLSHHRHPKMPWQDLEKVVNQDETQPLWYRYILVFRPPVRQHQAEFRKQYF